MSDGDDGTETPEDGETADELAPDVGADELAERFDTVEADLENAETEADLDRVEADLEAVAATLEAAVLPEPDEDEDDAEDPRAALEERLEGLRETLEDARGPYGEDVVETIETTQETVEGGEWTDRGEDEVLAAAGAFLEAAGEVVEVGTETPTELEAVDTALGTVATAVTDAALDADEDAAAIATLLEATDGLAADLEDAQEWDDLTVIEKLRAQGFYDRLNSQNRRDFPPELSVVRIAESENDPERVLLALEHLDSEFMQENCIAALKRMGSPAAYDAVMQKAKRRDFDAIEVLGKIGNDDALETLHDYIDGESNPPLQKVTLRAIGEIGSSESVQPVADRLVAEDPEVRSLAARALGLLGDTRAVAPLADVLADDEEDAVRASAAWALRAIGTERALSAAAEYAADRSYIVQTEADRAAGALGTPEAEPTA
jgi:HEAT repeat protein/ElaB/YqjD/DUF883 family membrane-anchored ribosome-binding protein